MTDDEIQQYRLAGLLHDIGHYPYSHAMEEAIREHYSSTLLSPATGDISSNLDEGAKPLNHESAGERVLTLDHELAKIRDKDYWQTIADIFRRQKPPRFANLVSSDLDADRIDYLMRTAHHTGLPYGNVDIEYLLSQIQLDDQERICFRSKAIRAAEHLLVCRYFDYQQVAFNKTVAGLEWLLREVLGELLTRKKMDCSANWVENAVTSGAAWHCFDDTYLVQTIRELANETMEDTEIGPMVRAILERTPPKLVGEIEYIAGRDEEAKQNFRRMKTIINHERPKWADKFGIPLRHWHIWAKNGIELTKAGSYVPISAALETGSTDSDKAKDRYEQSLRIIEPNNTTSTPIMEIPYSLMSILADKALYSLRVYVLLTSEKESLRTRIREEIHNTPDLSWK
ncbi:MAG TPA: HD domain-containing protein [Gemmataceae bacterium]|nr:HD domain-containing protein [Gemmataceae bacterium]